VGVRPDGTLAEGFEDQHDQIWQNTLAILAAANMPQAP
jgi:2-iminobutanoate/2-iminopropanoate deaminase